MKQIPSHSNPVLGVETDHTPLYSTPSALYGSLDRSATKSKLGESGVGIAELAECFSEPEAPASQQNLMQSIMELDDHHIDFSISFFGGVILFCVGTIFVAFVL